MYLGKLKSKEVNFLFECFIKTVFYAPKHKPAVYMLALNIRSRAEKAEIEAQVIELSHEVICILIIILLHASFSLENIEVQIVAN